MQLRARQTAVLNEVNGHSTVTWEATTPKGHECLLFAVRTYANPMQPFEAQAAILEAIGRGETVTLLPTAATCIMDNLPCRLWHGSLAGGGECWVLVTCAALPPAAQLEWDEAVRRGEVLPMNPPQIPALISSNGKKGFQHPH